MGPQDPLRCPRGQTHGDLPGAGALEAADPPGAGAWGLGPGAWPRSGLRVVPALGGLQASSGNPLPTSPHRAPKAKGGRRASQAPPVPLDPPGPRALPETTVPKAAP